MASFLHKHAEGSSSESIAKEITGGKTAHLDKTVRGSYLTCCDVDVMFDNEPQNGMTNVAELRTIAIKKEMESENARG